MLESWSVSIQKSFHTVIIICLPFLQNL